MKNIIRGKDDLLYRLQIDGPGKTEYLLSDFDNIRVDVFTLDENSYCTLDSSYIDTQNNLLRVPASALTDATKFPDGVVRLRLFLGITDSVFPDSVNDQSATVETCYFLTTINDING